MTSLPTSIQPDTTLSTDHSIRPARLSDIEAVQDVERAAGRLFAEIGMHDIAEDEPPSAETLAHCIDVGQAWVAEVDGRPVGYAIAEVIDGAGHLEQVSVHPEFGRRGLGRALIDAVVVWARGRAFPAVTLLTFRDVPWNAPYYDSLGFGPLDDASLGPELCALRLHEAEIGLDTSARLAMRLPLKQSSPSNYVLLDNPSP